MQAVQKVNGAVLWANLHLLFWLSLIPFVTAWMGMNDFASLPVALYGIVIFFAAVAYTILIRALIGYHGLNSPLAVAIGEDFKGKLSLVIYAASIIAAFFQPLLACAGYVSVAIIWLVPDKRIERVLNQ